MLTWNNKSSIARKRQTSLFLQVHAASPKAKAYLFFPKEQTISDVKVLNTVVMYQESEELVRDLISVSVFFFSKATHVDLK